MEDIQLDKIKRLLGISDMEQDDLLYDLLEDAQSYFIAITGASTVESRYEFIINDVTAKLYNRKGSEGMESESVDGYSTSYAQDLFSDYMGILERDFNLNDEHRQKGRVFLYWKHHIPLNYTIVTERHNMTLSPTLTAMFIHR